MFCFFVLLRLVYAGDRHNIYFLFIAFDPYLRATHDCCAKTEYSPASHMLVHLTMAIPGNCCCIPPSAGSIGVDSLFHRHCLSAGVEAILCFSRGGRGEMQERIRRGVGDWCVVALLCMVRKLTFTACVGLADVPGFYRQIAASHFPISMLNH